MTVINLWVTALSFSGAYLIRLGKPAVAQQARQQLLSQEVIACFFKELAQLRPLLEELGWSIEGNETNPETTEIHLASLDCRLPLALLHADIELITDD